MCLKQQQQTIFRFTSITQKTQINKMIFSKRKTNFDIELEIYKKIKETQLEIILLLEQLLNTKHKDIDYELIPNKPTKNNPYTIQYVEISRKNSRKKNVYQVNFFKKGKLIEDEPEFLTKKISDISLHSDQTFSRDDCIESVKFYFCMFCDWRNLFLEQFFKVNNYKFGETNDTLSQVTCLEDIKRDFSSYDRKFNNTPEFNEQELDYELYILKHNQKKIYDKHMFISIMYSLTLEAK